jgi:hypothetical protein
MLDATPGEFGIARDPVEQNLHQVLKAKDDASYV